MRHAVLIRLYTIFAVLLCLGGVAGFVRLWPALGRPFGGFLWQYDYAAGSSVNYDVPRHWPGSQAGLIPYTKIVSINGRPALDYGAVYASTPIGTNVTYGVITPDGERRTITAPVLRFDLGYLVDVYALIFLAGLMFAGAGYILLRSAHDTGRTLIAFIMLVGADSAFYHTHNGSISSFYDARFFVSVMWAPSPPLLGALLCHAALVYPHRRSIVSRYPHLVPLCYTIGIFLGLFLGFTFFFGSNPRIARLENTALYTSVGYMVLGVVATIVSGLWTAFRFRGTFARTERRQVRIVAAAWVFTMLMLVGTVGAVGFRVPTAFEFLTFIAVFIPI